MKLIRGKDKYYRKLMRTVPGFENTKSDTRFKYKYSDIYCSSCIEYVICKHDLCPYIMENLADLINDKQFMRAVVSRRNYRPAHERTLNYLNRIYESVK